MEQKPIPTVAAGIKLICIGIVLDLSESFWQFRFACLQFAACFHFVRLFLYIFFCPWLYSTERFLEQ